MAKRPFMLGALLLVVAWLALGEWQRREFVRQRSLLQGSLEEQAESMIRAVASIVESHRWFGPFVQDELTVALEGIARSSSVLAVAIVQQDEVSDSTPSDALLELGQVVNLFSAGDSSLIDVSWSAGGRWNRNGYSIVHPFVLTTSPPHRRMQAANDDLHDGPGDHSGPPWLADSPQRRGRFKAILVLDRSAVDLQVGQELRNRTVFVGLGGLLLICTAVAWRSTVRLAQARGAAQVLRAEARHLRELGQAAAGLAHETRNPLGLIRGWTQRLVTVGLPTDDQQQQAEAALEECDRVTARINQFLAFARPPALILESVHLRDLLEQLQVLLEPDLDGREINIDVQDVDIENTVQADREQLRQALFNLLQNAIQFSPDQGTIRISLLARRRGKYRLEIADEGPGPPADAVDSLFEPYITSRPAGTGLGLAIVQRISTAHGWHAGYSPRAEGGSVFWIDGMKPSENNN